MPEVIPHGRWDLHVWETTEPQILSNALIDTDPAHCSVMLWFLDNTDTDANALPNPTELTCHPSLPQHTSEQGHSSATPTVLLCTHRQRQAAFRRRATGRESGFTWLLVSITSVRPEDFCLFNEVLGC